MNLLEEIQNVQIHSLKFESLFNLQHNDLLIINFILEPVSSAVSFFWSLCFYFIVLLKSHLMIFFLSRCNGGKHCKAFGQDIEIKNRNLKIKFALVGWIENPIKSVVLTFPIDKIVFPAVTLCPRDSRPDRWGTAIKIFDQLNTDCGSKRWDSMFNSKANEIIVNSLQGYKRERKKNISYK